MDCIWTMCTSLDGNETVTGTNSPKRGQHRRYSPLLVDVVTQMPHAGVCRSAAEELGSTGHVGLEGL